MLQQDKKNLLLFIYLLVTVTKYILIDSFLNE